MIRQHGTRRKGREVYQDIPPLHLTTTEKALKSLIEAELKFGGEIKELTPTQVVVETSLFNGSSIDTTYFEGPQDEMEPLVAICYYYAKAQAEQRDGIISDALVEYEKFPEGAKGSPFFIVNLAPMIFGNATLKRAVEMMQQERAGG